LFFCIIVYDCRHTNLIIIIDTNMLAVRFVLHPSNYILGILACGFSMKQLVASEPTVLEEAGLQILRDGYRTCHKHRVYSVKGYISCWSYLIRVQDPESPQISVLIFLKTKRGHVHCRCWRERHRSIEIFNLETMLDFLCNVNLMI